MQTSEDANRLRWRGQPGFFEIWFLVLFDPNGQQAWWFRYTLFSPVRGVGEPRRATLWAAAFDLTRPDRPSRAAKAILPIEAFVPRGGEQAGFSLGPAELSPGICRGEVRSEHSISWDLRYQPASTPVSPREPAFVHYVPLPTRVAHAHDGISFSGTVTVDGRTYEVRDAPGLQKHLWGRRRVEELFWLYCPRFQQDPQARLEATAVRTRQSKSSVRMAPLWLQTSDGQHGFHKVSGLLLTRVATPRVGVLSFQATSVTRRIHVEARCAPETLVGYVYRDPAGWDVHVAQSDVATVEAELFERPHPFAAFRSKGRLNSAFGAAVEFHAPSPIPGVRYIPWDGTSLPAPAGVP